MDDLYQQDDGLRALAMRVAALEDNVAFLEGWCEEQQDLLDRAAGPVAYDYEVEPEPEPSPRAVLRVVDLRDEVLAVLEAATDDAEALVDDPGLDRFDGLDSETITAVVETEHERRVRQIRDRLERIRVRLRAEP
jgi:hypothetical protein